MLKFIRYPTGALTMLSTYTCCTLVHIAEAIYPDNSIHNLRHWLSEKCWQTSAWQYEKTRNRINTLSADTPTSTPPSTEPSPPPRTRNHTSVYFIDVFTYKQNFARKFSGDKCMFHLSRHDLCMWRHQNFMVTVPVCTIREWLVYIPFMRYPTYYMIWYQEFIKLQSEGWAIIWVPPPHPIPPFLVFPPSRRNITHTTPSPPLKSHLTVRYRIKHFRYFLRSVHIDDDGMRTHDLVKSKHGI